MTKPGWDLGGRVAIYERKLRRERRARGQCVRLLRSPTIPTTDYHALLHLRGYFTIASTLCTTLPITPIPTPTP